MHIMKIVNKLSQMKSEISRNKAYTQHASGICWMSSVNMPLAFPSLFLN